jgi:hypothetical protein
MLDQPNTVSRRDAGSVAGAAVVRLRDGKSYVGHAVISGGAVTMLDAKLRHRDVLGERLYPPRGKTWPLRAVSRVTWTEAA